jgi:hypothetical protein
VLPRVVGHGGVLRTIEVGLNVGEKEVLERSAKEVMGMVRTGDVHWRENARTSVRSRNDGICTY